MTIKELLERRNDMARPEEERIGLGIFNYYVERIEETTKYEKMSSASDILYGILIGMKMTGYINEKEFKNLNLGRTLLESDFFNRTENL